MRKMLFLIPMLVSSAACSDADELAEKAGVERTAAAAPSNAPTSAEAKAFAFTRNLDEPGGGTLEFAYKWPAEVSAEPALAAELEADREERFAQSKAEWQSSAAECPADSVSCRSYSNTSEYQVVANLPRFLSLSNKFYSYTGGAHGIYGKGTAVWDRQAKASLDPQAMFVSQAALERAVSSKACAALDRERAKRREGANYGEPGEWPNQCPAMDETTLFLGSSNGKTFDRLGLYYGPYTAGAYAEGEYEIDLPVDAALLAAVKPEYRSAFSIKG